MRFNVCMPVCLIIGMGLPCIGQSQNHKEEATKKMEKALELVENEEYSRSHALLQEAIDLNPDEQTLYEYEIADSYYIQKQYSKTIEILKNLLHREDLQPEIIQLLGNAYDMQGERDQAIKTYREGLTLFPDAGCLYLELGNMEYSTKNYQKALPLYELGILKDPSFPGNYYQAAKLFSLSTEVVWAMMYGEIFMNLERTTQRTREISRMLYENYASCIRFEGKPISDFCNNTIVYSDSPLIGNQFPIHYDKNMELALQRERKIDIASLHRIRKNFIAHFSTRSGEFHNVLFDYHHQIIAAGHFEAYTHWLLGYGNVNTSSEWINTHKTQWNNFLKWFENNPIKISKKHFFIRSQME